MKFSNPCLPKWRRSEKPTDQKVLVYRTFPNVGGWAIPFEKKYSRQTWSFPQVFRLENERYLKSPPSFIHLFFLLIWSFQTPNVRRYDKTPKTINLISSLSCFRFCSSSFRGEQCRIYLWGDRSGRQFFGCKFVWKYWTSNLQESPPPPARAIDGSGIEPLKQCSQTNGAGAVCLRSNMSLPVDGTFSAQALRQTDIQADTQSTWETWACTHRAVPWL